MNVFADIKVCIVQKDLKEGMDVEEAAGARPDSGQTQSVEPIELAATSHNRDPSGSAEPRGAYRRQEEEFLGAEAQRARHEGLERQTEPSTLSLPCPSRPMTYSQLTESGYGPKMPDQLWVPYGAPASAGLSSSVSHSRSDLTPGSERSDSHKRQLSDDSEVSTGREKKTRDRLAQLSTGSYDGVRPWHLEKVSTEAKNHVWPELRDSLCSCTSEQMLHQASAATTRLQGRSRINCLM